MKFLVTGNTGFKGAWLTALLTSLGHEVFGYSDRVEPRSLFSRANLLDSTKLQVLDDISNYKSLSDLFSRSQPHVAIHLAAQSIVSEAQSNPARTFETNVQGTLNFLRAATENAPADCVNLVVTTDKVYFPSRTKAHDEGSRLGGTEAYSQSKSLADSLTLAWAQSFPDRKFFVARAGNVIGAFDHNQNRLVPDLVRSVRAHEALQVRNLFAVRPWQHVLDCLNGYLLLISKALDGVQPPIALNFGPSEESEFSVQQILEIAKKLVPDLSWESQKNSPSFKEEAFLKLNSGLARRTLGWSDVLSTEQAVEWSIRELVEHDVKEVMERQIQDFRNLSPQNS